MDAAVSEVVTITDDPETETEVVAVGGPASRQRRAYKRKNLIDVPPPIIINKCGEVIGKRQKRMIINLYNSKTRCNGSDNDNKSATKRIPVYKIASELSQAVGIGQRSIMQVISEYRKQGTIVAPNRSRPNFASTVTKLDESQKDAIRRIVHAFFFRKELPTLDKVFRAVNEDEQLPNLRRTTLFRVLKSLNFEFTKRNGKSILIDRDDIVCWRRNYLRQIRKFRVTNNRKIFYLDETWINIAYTAQYGQTVVNDDAARTAKQGDSNKAAELVVETPKPSGKDKSLIVLHIGSEDGFLDGGALVFESNKSKDYHEDMDHDVFESWFQQIVGDLPPQSVIVMDNVSYHSRKLNEIPNRTSRKGEIMQWLLDNSIAAPVQAVKAELLQLVAQHTPTEEAYVVDKIAEDAGHTVLRLPPSHCELNPIELIWVDLKTYVASNNTELTLSNLKKLLSEAMCQITTDTWRNCVKHVVEEVEPNMWELDNLVDIAVEPGLVEFDFDSDSDA